MKVIDNTASAREILNECRGKRQSIGLVPTMGALHAGHLSLVRTSQHHNEITVVSIFVNPLQFNNADDFAKYPVTLDSDLQTLEEQGVDFVFLPTREEMYPNEPRVEISFGHLDKVMEGQYRPGHFNGVAIVVAKLFNILQPTRAYFGQKDLQQFRIIEQLVNDFSIDIELIMMPIIREASGLAMSSRNRRLSEKGRQISSAIYQNLLKASKAIHDGSDISEALAMAIKALTEIAEIETEYLEAVNYEDLLPYRTNNGADRLVLCFAGYVEGVRLIDNVIVGEN